MEVKRSLLDRFREAADIQDEPLPGLPLVELAGECRVLIENHRGVAEYGSNQITINVKFGQICVCGDDLVLRRMIKGQMIIQGRIDCIRILRGCR